MGLAREGGAVRIVGSGNTAEVGDVLIERLLTIHRKVGKGSVGVVLRGESGGGRVEMRQVGGFPPISHTPCGIERAAFRVKGMADFVPNGKADVAVVHGGGCLRVELWGLEICCGKVE